MNYPKFSIAKQKDRVISFTNLFLFSNTQHFKGHFQNTQTVLFLVYSSFLHLYNLLSPSFSWHFKISSFYYAVVKIWWFRRWRICLQCMRPGFYSWVRKIPWRRNWQPTPVFLPGEFQGQRILAGYSLWDRMTEELTHFQLKYGHHLKLGRKILKEEPKLLYPG